MIKKTQKHLTLATVCLALILALSTFGVSALAADAPDGITISNPYENVDWNAYGQYKADFHAHSLNSDGADKTADMVEDHYAKGYDILAMTDHSYTTRAWFLADKDPLSAKREVEINAGLGRGGQGMIDIFDTNEQSATDHINSFFANYNDNGVDSGMAATIEAVEKLGGLTHINHPGRYTGGASGNADASNNPANVKKYVDLYLAYPSCVGIEIINKIDNESRCERILWDNILKQTMAQGRSVWGFSNDDSHSLDATGYSWNVMLMPTLSPYETRTAMESGAFYAVSRVSRPDGINATLPGGGEMPGSGDKSTLYLLEQKTPSISSIVVDEENAVITISGADYDVIEWIADGAVIATGETISISQYKDQIGSYVRAQLKSATGIAFTQPFGIKTEVSAISFGVMSDTHIGAAALASLTPETRLATAYQTFAEIDPAIDAIVTVGDFTESGTLDNYNAYKKIMDEYSPAQINLLSMGNHDNGQVDGAAARSRFEDVFGFPATNDVVVGGYHFITLSTADRVYNTVTYAQYQEWLEARLDAAHAEDPSKPIFVFMHHTIIDTCIGSRQAQMDPENDLREVLSKYSQVVTFSGHSHVSFVDPRNIWQGDFTALNCGSVYYAALDYTNPLTAGQTANTNIGYSPYNRGESSTAFVVEVDGTQVTVRRFELYYGQELTTPFVFDTSVDKANFPYRLEKRIAESSAPEFTAEAEISVTDITETGFSYTFTQAVNTSENIPDDGAFVYTVQIIEADTGLVADTARLQSNYFMVPQPATVTFSTNSLKENTTYDISVTPISYFGKVGDALNATCTTLATAPFAAEALTIQPGSTERDLNFNWYSGREDNAASQVQIAKKSAMTGDEFPTDGALVAEGTVGDAAANKSWHKVSVSGLEPDTSYIYRVSNDKNIYSEIYEFKTGKAGDFQFIAVGDPQLTTGDQDAFSIWPDPLTTTKAGWQNTIDLISEHFPEARFMAGTGDQIDTATDEAQYTNYFAPAQLRSLPVAPAVGNHEGEAGNFGWHFNVPNETAGSYFGNYWYTYNNALFVVLNTAPYPASLVDLDKYIPTMDATLKAATEANPTVKWIFVQHHKSTASPASHQTDADVLLWAPAFNALMDKYQVDFVLTGHDHVYSRSWFIKDNQKVTSVDYGKNSVVDPQGVLYFTLNTASGLKYYDFLLTAPAQPEWVNSSEGLYFEGKNTLGTPAGKPWYTNVGIQVKVPQFSTVDVTADSVTFKTYRADTMAVIDEYTVIKSGVRIENVSLQIGADQTQRNFVWYSDATEAGKVQIALKSAMSGGEFPAACEQFNATSSTAGVLQGLASFKATASGLVANTAYVYRVGDGVNWSEIYSFNTQAFNDAFSFLVAGDPQIGARNTANDTAAWAEALEKSQSAFPEASFIVTVGDQVGTETSEEHYNGFFAPDAFRSIPLAVVAGNHDVPSPLFAPHFNMPHMSNLGSTSPGSGDGDYWYIYNNTLFMSLDLVNTNVEEHEQFMIETIAAHPDVQWKVATVHFTLLFEQATNSGYWSITRPLREKLVPILSQLGIDVVLAGHDHSYVRTHMMDGLTPVIPEDGELSSVTNPPEEQVVYFNLNSSTGSIYVALSNTEQPFTAAKNQENTPNITKVDISETSLTVTTYRLTDMTVVDSFTIYKTDEEPKEAIQVNFSGVEQAEVRYYTNVAGWQTVGTFDDSCEFTIPDHHKATWGSTTVQVLKGGMWYTFGNLSVGDEPLVLDVPIMKLMVFGIAADCNIGVIQEDWAYRSAPAAVGAPNYYNVFDNGKDYKVQLYKPGFYPVTITAVKNDEYYASHGAAIWAYFSHFYQAEVPAGVTNVWISSYDWAVRGANAGDKIALLNDPSNLRDAKMRYDYEGVTYNVEFKLDGADPFEGLL